jgi:leucyl aminopeptidase
MGDLIFDGVSVFECKTQIQHITESDIRIGIDVQTKMTETPKTPSFPTWTHENPCTNMPWTDPVDISITTSTGTIKDDEEKKEINESDVVIFTVFAPKEEVADENKKDDVKESTDATKTVIPIVLSGIVKGIDESSLIQGGLSNWINDNSKSFKNGATIGTVTPTLRVLQNGSMKRYIVMGLGPVPEETNSTSTSTESETKDKKEWFIGYGFKLGSALATIIASEKKASKVTFIVPDIIGCNKRIVKDFSTSLYESLYVDNRFRTGSNKVNSLEDLTSLHILVEGDSSTGSTTIIDQTVLETGKNIASGVYLCKDIVNAPHNVLNSLSIAETAQRIAIESNGLLKCTIMGSKQCEEEYSMGAYLGVARGSETEPQFIHLVYTPPSPIAVTKRIGLVGKGVVFDTGGYNIKVGMMELMKFDCGGAAAVLGSAYALSLLVQAAVKNNDNSAIPTVECHFIVAACDNMINEKAYVPSDVLIASNGKTIEVMNTDAEGRLTLADALIYADKTAKCDSIIELSTLTGACMISLGKNVAGLWTNNDQLANELESVSKQSSGNDKVWRMPMVQEYKEELKSIIADIKSLGGRYGSAIHAALFLQEFVTSTKPFAHIDIAGPVWNDKSGATGYGVKLILSWILNQT